jgi:hypothetical protein
VSSTGFLSGIYSNWYLTGNWGLSGNGTLGNTSPNVDPTLRGTTPDPDPAAVPEPSTMLLFGSGLLAVISRRRKK